VFIRGGFIMARESDIHLAFVRAITLDGRGRRVLTTAVFQKQLEEVNHVWTLQECNRWIQRYQNYFFELNDILMPHRNNMLLIEKPDGFVLADKSLTPVPGEKVTFQLGGYPQLGRLFSSGIITSDGETIDGEGLEGIIVLGKVTSEIVCVYEQLRPTI
jgi:DNA polymerase V